MTGQEGRNARPMTRMEGAVAREDERPVVALLLQLADDDLVVAHRASEWLGLAPHLEEDVAFASIAQDEMGHAATYYRLLEDLGCGPSDHLAHLRSAKERRNSRLMLQDSLAVELAPDSL